VKLYVDLETLQLIEGPGFRNPVTSLRFKRGDGAKLEVVFLENGTTPVEIGNPLTLGLQFGVKPRNRFDSGYLVFTDDWTLPVAGAPNPTYLCSPNFHTAELDSELQVGSPTGNELAEVILMGEISWHEGLGDPTSTRTFTVIVENDVNRGTEGTPEELPDPGDWLTDQLAERGVPISRTDGGVGHLYPPALRIEGDILDANGDPANLDDLEFSAFDGSGRPVYETPSGPPVSLYWQGGSWSLEYDDDTNRLFEVDSELFDPTGLVFAAQPGAGGPITITNPSGVPVPKMGDRGIIDTTGEVFFWTGTRWLTEGLQTVPQSLTAAQKVQLGQNWPEALPDFVRPAKFSVVGDSMSAGTTGQWSTLIQNHPLFANTIFNNVAQSGAKTFDQNGAYWDANVLPAAPVGDEVAYMSSLIGINDIFQVGGSAGTVRDIYERIKGIWKKGRDAGFKVIAFTLQDHSFGAAGIVEAEQRKSQLNQMILSDSSLYDYLVPLHQLIPDENTYAFSPGGTPPDLLHLNAAGNQLIADTIVRLVGPQERGGNGEVKDQSLAAIEENLLRLAIQSKDQFYSPYNLALSTDFTTSGGTVTPYLGFRRLNTTTTSGSQAAMQFEWPLLDSGNTINWQTERYRGLFVDVDPVTLSTEQILSVFVGTNNQIKDTHYAGFELRRNGANFETRIIELRSGGTASESAWVSIGNVNNLKFLFFHKGDEMSLFYRPSNGASLPTIWQEVNHTGGGGPNSFAASSGRVVVSLESLGSPSSSSGIVTVREIVPFEGDKLPLQRIQY
jgi:lysophospholipase L1-like esterase